jgi:hypothetical protein
MLVENRLNLSPIFKAMPGDDYLLRIQRLNFEPGLSKTVYSSSIRFKWNPDNPELCQVSGIAPGLYKISLLNAKDDLHMPMQIEAWVLVCKAETYEKASGSFMEAAESIQSWGAEGGVDTARSFLRLYLGLLSNKVQH